MVAHHDVRTAAVDHELDEFEYPQLIASPVDKVTDEHRATVGVPVGAGPVVRLVSEVGQQILEGGRAAVHIADDVVTLHATIVARGYDMSPPCASSAHSRNRVAAGNALKLTATSPAARAGRRSHHHGHNPHQRTLSCRTPYSSRMVSDRHACAPAPRQLRNDWSNCDSCSATTSFINAKLSM